METNYKLRYDKSEDKYTRKKHFPGIVEISFKMENLVNGKTGSNATKPLPSQVPTGDPNCVTSLLIISLTVHGCMLCFLITRAALDHLATKAVAKRFDKFFSLHVQQNWMLPKIITEQVVTWALIPAAVVGLVHEELITCPFVPKVSHEVRITRTIFCVNIGRYIYKCAQDIILCSHLERLKVDLLHHIVTLCCYCVFLWTTENLLLGLVGILMESDTVFRDVIHLCKKLDYDRFSCSVKTLYIVYAIMTLVMRGTIPITFTIVSLTKQDVMSMHFVSISLWFIELLFFGALSIWIIAQAGLRLHRTLLGHALPVNITSCIEEAPSSGGQRQGQQLPRVIPTKPIHSTKTDKPFSLNYKNDMSYLNPYSNVNINDNANSSRHNLVNKKLKPKENVNDITKLLKAAQPNMLNNELAACIQPVQTQTQTGPNSACYVSRSADVSEHSDQVVVETRLAENHSGVQHVILSGEGSQLTTGVHRVHSHSKPRPTIALSQGLNP